MLCVRQQIIQMWRQEAVELLTAIFEAKIECWGWVLVWLQDQLLLETPNVYKDCKYWKNLL